MNRFSTRNPGPWKRPGNVIDFKARQQQSRRKKGTQLLCAGFIAVGIAAIVPIAPGKVLPLLDGASQTPSPITLFSLGIDICQGGARNARKVTCLVDGDTGWENGVKWRLKGIDTPELSSPGCKREMRKAVEARDRLRQLMSTGYELDWTGTSGSYGRKLVRIRLASGHYAGKVLMDEGLAQPWPNSGNVWCDG